MSTIINNTNGGYRMFIKGASEIVLGRCSQIIASQGTPEPFTEEDAKNLIENVIEPMASNGLRTICLAYRDFPQDKGEQ